MPTLREAIEWARTRVEPLLDALPYDDERPPDPRWFLAAPIMLDANDDADAARSWLGRPGLAEVWSEGKGDPDVDTRDSRWRDHVELAARVAAGEVTLGQRPDGLLDVVTQLALAGPGVSALRALSRVCGGPTMLADLDLRDAAAAGAWPLRTLLSHPESIALVRSVVRSGPYWRRALAYCTRGGLQSVLDEYVHVVHDLRGLAREPWADAVWQLAGQLRVSAGLKTAAVVADEVTVGTRARTVRFKSTPMRSRFSARYGEAREAVGEERTRAESLPDAFNSPFWPFVLATTSVGQEGLDFHAYCHAVVHWNLPSNPVDLEQREGRAHQLQGTCRTKERGGGARRGGISPCRRRSVDGPLCASESVIASDDPDIVPFWVYPGEAHIQRHVPMLPFSRDEERYRKLKRSLGLYRMVLGQPRQEDLIELLSGRFDHVQAMAAELRVDLSPPRRAFSPKHGLGLRDPNKSKGGDDGATAR